MRKIKKAFKHTSVITVYKNYILLKNIQWEEAVIDRLKTMTKILMLLGPIFRIQGGILSYLWPTGTMLYAIWKIKTMFSTCPGLPAFCGEMIERSQFLRPAEILTPWLATEREANILEMIHFPDWQHLQRGEILSSY